MGFFDSLFGKKKMTLDEANQVNQSYTQQNPVPASNQNAMVRNATSLMSSRKFQQSAEIYQQLVDQYPENKGTYLSQIGACQYFLGDYDKAIEYYVAALDNGADRGMMDDNVFEACEAIFKGTQLPADIERYLELFPAGNHLRAAKKLVGNH